MSASGTASERVFELLRSRILEGRYPVGARLGEQALAEEHGVSRTPVREALRRLEADGYVTLRPHVGAEVQAWSRRDLRETLSVRAELEGQAAYRAATRISPAQCDALAEICDRIEALDAIGTPEHRRSRTELNRSFHGLILQVSSLAPLERMALQLMDMEQVIQTFGQFAPAEVSRSDSDHRMLVRVLRLGDAVLAQALMRCHILTAAAVLEEHRRAGEAG